LKFSEVIGQDRIKESLIKTVKDGRVSHAQLFLGPEGSGKLPLAIAYAQYVNCKNKSETDSCGVCPSCIKYEKLAHPDLHFIYPVSSTAKVKKPLSKNFIREWAEIVTEEKGYFNIYDWYNKIGLKTKQGIISADDCNSIIKDLRL